MKRLSANMLKSISKEIKMMLHAHRDCLRNKDVDTRDVGFDCRDGYYGEAFGIMRALDVLGYGEIQSDNMDGLYYGYEQREQNLKWWFSQICQEVLDEEGFTNGTHFCEYCKKKYGRG